MSLKSDLRALFLADAGIAAVIGTNTKSGDKCIRPERLYESDVLPAIEIHVEDTATQNDLSGDSGTSNPVVVISSIANTQAGAEALRDAVSSKLEPFIGATATGHIGGVFHLKDRGAWQPYEDGSDEGEFVEESHFRIWYTRA